MASIIKNKDIYDPSQGDPLEPIKKSLGILDSILVDIGKSANAFQSELREIPKTGGGEELKRLSEGIQKLKKETDSYNKVNESRTKIVEQIKKSESQLVSLYDSEAQQLAEVKLELQERRAELKKTAKENKVAKDSITGLNIELSKLRKQYDQLSKEQRENDKVGGKLLRQIQQLDTETKQLTASTGRFQKNVGNYPGLFNKTTFSLKSLGGELLAAGGIVGGVQLLVDGFKAFSAQVQKNIQVSKQLDASFAVGAEQSRRYAANILAIADTFDQDFNEVTQAAITVSKELGVGVQEATALIEEGFLKGSNNSGEFLDILKEYPTQFREAGIGADQAFAIINQQVTEGIYSDKGVDAIKEGGLRLRENTKAVQDALAPLDESIKKQIEQEVAAGNSFKAIQLVSEALNDASLTADETQAIIAGVFAGPGEDAGLRYLQTLKDIDTNLDNVAVSASESEQSSLNLSRAWNQFVAGVSDSNGIFSKAFSLLKNLLAGAVNSLALLIDKVNGGEGALEGLIKTVEKLKTSQKSQTDAQITNNNKLDANEQELASNRQRRFQEQQRRNAKRIQDSNKQLAQTSKEIEKIDELSETEDEAALASIERIVETEEEIAELKDEIADFNVARADEEAKRILDIETQFNEQRKELIADTAQFASEQFVKLVTDGELSFKKFAKFILLTFLDLVEKQILIAIAESTAKAALAGVFDPTAIIRTAIAVGLVKGLFSVVKSQVQNFAEGTEYVSGPGTETSDSIPAMLSKGERVIPANINKQLHGINNDELPSLIGGSNEVNNSSVDSKMLEKLDRLGLAYKKGDYWYIERGNGKVESFKE
jgi:myosin heavy subunit